jgi:hypothetical protein
MTSAAVTVRCTAGESMSGMFGVAAGRRICRLTGRRQLAWPCPGDRQGVPARREGAAQRDVDEASHCCGLCPVRAPLQRERHQLRRRHRHDGGGVVQGERDGMSRIQSTSAWSAQCRAARSVAARVTVGGSTPATVSDCCWTGSRRGTARCR